jgi:hypothetical protein
MTKSCGVGRCKRHNDMQRFVQNIVVNPDYKMDGGTLEKTINEHGPNGFTLFCRFSEMTIKELCSKGKIKIE